eukprot:g75406.t1
MSASSNTRQKNLPQQTLDASPRVKEKGLTHWNNRALPLTIAAHKEMATLPESWNLQKKHRASFYVATSSFAGDVLTAKAAGGTQSPPTSALKRWLPTQILWRLYRKADLELSLTIATFQKGRLYSTYGIGIGNTALSLVSCTGYARSMKSDCQNTLTN